MKKIFFPFILMAAGLSSPAAGQLSISENFSTNPLAAGSPWTVNNYPVPSTSANSSVNDTSMPLYPTYSNQFQWNAPGLPTGLNVELNSSTASTRLDQPLGTTLTDNSSFVLTADFTLNIVSAPSDGGMQIAFGLTDGGATGGDRTGSSDSYGNYISPNTFNDVEWNYFANIYPAVYPPGGNTPENITGPSVTPTIFGAQVSSSPFDNYASVIDASTSLGNNGSQIPYLANNVEYQAVLAYDASTMTFTSTMYEVQADAGLQLINTNLPPLQLGSFQFDYDPSNSFNVSTLSIMAYNDGFTTAGDPSLVGDITYQSISLVATPEPSSLVLLVVAGACGLAALGRRKLAGRSSR